MDASGGASGVRSCPSCLGEYKRLLRVFLRSGINKSERGHQGPRLDISTIHDHLPLPLLVQFATTFENPSAPLPLPELPFCVIDVHPPPKVVQENTKKQSLSLPWISARNPRIHQTPGHVSSHHITYYSRRNQCVTIRTTCRISPKSSPRATSSIWRQSNTRPSASPVAA